jgi:CRISPR-associated protein Csm4
VDRTYFLPKPGLKPPGFEKDEIRGNFAKSVKSSGFISCSIFEKWIQNEEVDYRQLIKETETLNKNIKTNVRSRVALNRITEESNLYFVGETVFNKELSGLYFAVECQHDIFQKLKQLFEFLREEGIGGERSLGYGRFNAEYEENFKIPNVADGEKYITLSLYSPKDQEELDNSAISYQLLRRSGWSIIGEKHLLQKEVLMFSEGSVFHKPVKGRIVNVAPDGQKQAIYKCGKAFLVKAR